MKVLVVDDDPRLREAVEVGLQLQWQDAQVLVASDGEDGLELFFQQTPDVVLLDVSMPRMNGFEVLRDMAGEVLDVLVNERKLHGRTLKEVADLVGEDERLVPLLLPIAGGMLAAIKK